MKGNSSSYKRPLAKSANLHPKKDHKSSNKFIECSVHQFQFSLPTFSIPLTLRNIFSAPVPAHNQQLEQRPFERLEDDRKEQIKQKIKFRVKQEMWNLIKKNYQKPALIDSSYQESPQAYINREKQEPFVKGESFLRIIRDDITFQKKSNKSQRIFSANSLKENDKNSNDMKGRGHRRVWSSFVIMKGKDRMELKRNSKRVNDSSFNIQKLDAYKIEPWKDLDDHENLYEEH